jgi:type VI secretion system secreted protein VgrG
MALTQTNRLLAIQTPLGEDVLAVQSFTGNEQFARLFQYEAELLSEDHNLSFEDIIGAEVTVRLETTRGDTRWFHGIVSRFVQGPASDTRYGAYRATIVPWLWLLTRTSDCRIWSGSDQTRTVPEIVEQLFQDRGLDAFENHLTGTYHPWEYCVQYRETDFNFVSRLLEQEGISYYFQHEDGKHTLVLVDSIDRLTPLPGYEEISYRSSEHASTDLEHIRHWSLQKQLLSGSFVHKDFDFERPKKDLGTEPRIIARAHAGATFEIYDYPGLYTDPGHGKALAEIRIQEIQSDHALLQGQADARGLAAGHTVNFQDLPREDQNRKYLVLSVQHNVRSDTFESGRASDTGDLFYHCDFSVMPADEVFRPARITPKPLIDGPQTAIVVGPVGEEIHTDQYGRVKVRFHWDRYGAADEKSSCWIRVAHSWAGKKWGAFFTPRIGQEVVVEFLEGDPDRPIITGRVYNAENTVPYPLPAHKTLSTLKSNSSKGGQGFNEIRFEDKKGEEQIFVHGEKNVDIRVKNDRFETIGNNRHLDVKKDMFEHVENNRHEIVDADHKEKIGKDRHLKVVGKEVKAVDGSQSLTVKGDVIEVFKANHSEQTTADYYLKADNICIEAMTNITLKVGQTTLAMEAGGLGIKTTGQVKIESTGPMEIKATSPLKVESAATADIKSVSTTVKGDAMVTIQGGLVKIN